MDSTSRSYQQLIDYERDLVETYHDIDECGGFEIQIPRTVELENNNVIYDWCEKNCTGRWAGLVTWFIFENESDRTLFMLRWL